METTTFLEVDLRRQGIVPILEAVQYDTGRTVKCFMSGITAGAKTARVYCIKPSGKETYTEGKIINESCITFELKKQMIAEEGTTICQLHLMDEEKVITSFDFRIKVKKNRIAGSDITSSDDYDALIKLLAELEKYKELMITKEGHILSAQDKFGTSFGKDLLMIDTENELSEKNKRAYFSVTNENVTTWKNLPGGFMRGNVVMGVREVFWRNTVHVMVKVTELFPDYGKQYINLFNNGKWGEWVVKSDDRLGKYILNADDIVGNNFNKDFLMVSLPNKISSENERAYFSIKQSEFSSWRNIPPGMKQGEATIIGVRDVYWRNSGCVLVKVTEFYPSAGKQYLNMYNADEWMGWQTVHTEKNSVTKTMMSNRHVNDVNKVPTSALVYYMQQTITELKNQLKGDTEWKSYSDNGWIVKYRKITQKQMRIEVKKTSNGNNEAHTGNLEIAGLPFTPAYDQRITCIMQVSGTIVGHGYATLSTNKGMYLFSAAYGNSVEYICFGEIEI